MIESVLRHEREAGPAVAAKSRLLAIAPVTGLAVLAAALPGVAAAAPAGVPDPAYGNGGISAVTVPGKAAKAMALAPTASGLAVAAYSYTNGTNTPGDATLVGLGADGSSVPGFGSTVNNEWPDAALTEPAGRIVVATAAGDVLGFDATGHPDASFGSGGRVSAGVYNPRLAEAPDGTLLVAGDTTDGIGLTRLTPDGHPLGTASVPVPNNPPPNQVDVVDDYAVAGVAALGDGRVIVVGTDTFGVDPAVFLARFAPAGAADTSFGTGGFETLDLGVAPAGGVSAGGVVRDASDRLIIAGSHLGNAGRSVDVAVGGMLVRIDADGRVDRSFGHGGASFGDDADGLDAVALEADGKVLAATSAGTVARFTSTGAPDLSFGVGGESFPLPGADDFSSNPGLAVAGDGAFLPGQEIPTTNAAFTAPFPLAVERVLLDGAGVVAPHAGFDVEIVPRRGRPTVRVPLSLADQTLTATIAVPIRPASEGLPDGGSVALVAPVVGARSGTVRVVGVGGSATATGARFALTRQRGDVAAIGILRPSSCRRAQTTRLVLTGRFLVLARGVRIANRSRNAALSVIEGCRGRARVHVRSGRVTVRRR